MSDANKNNNIQPTPAVKNTDGQSGFSPIWIVPIVALLIGLFLIYRVVSETGPSITISFKTASGMEAGKTKIRFKDVIVGEVSKIDFSPDLSGVVITAKMHPEGKAYLTDKARFWVVKPQITGGGISGLGTLLSGNYIGMDPSDKGMKARHFTGLEHPPVIESEDDGSQFKLRAAGLGSLQAGSPVYFKQIPVGQVVKYKLLDSGDVEFEVFIHAPHHVRVNQASRFWNASGIDVTVNANGVEINTESLVAIIGGGIAFDTVARLGRDAAKAPAKDHVFTLFPSQSASRNPSYRDKQRALLYFDESVRGLLPGAPVELRGFQVGKVAEVSMEFNRETSNFRLPVLIELEPERVKITGESDFNRTIETLVNRGLRAQLKTGNLVLGKLLVELEFHPDAKPAQVDFSGDYPVIPTLEGGLAALESNAVALVSELRETVKNINSLIDSDDTQRGLKDLAATITNIKRLTADLEQNSAPQLAHVLKEAGATLDEAQTMLAANSTTRTEINRLLTELAEAARSIRLLADYLEQNPESIIKGKNQ